MLPIFDNLPGLSSLITEIYSDMGNTEVYVILMAMGAMLTIHGLLVLIIASVFHYLNKRIGRIGLKFHLGAGFVSYFFAITLIILTHLTEIVIWTYILVGLKVFPSNPQTFYFAGEMYTTVGFGSYTLPSNWRILPILISFSGIFAVSMSGAALYTMMGSLLGRNEPHSGNLSGQSDSTV